jgi:uncharacterized protein Yka (UPF0111/DUF47 family)
MLKKYNNLFQMLEDLSKKQSDVFHETIRNVEEAYSDQCVRELMERLSEPERNYNTYSHVNV